MKKEDMFEDLRLRIIKGELKPGQWLVERELSETYHISRTPVREKLRKLANLGIVELQPTIGYQVKKLRIEEIIEIFNAREAVEGESARLSCLSESPEFFVRIEELKEELGAVDIRTDSAHGVAVGKRIHDLIMETAKNSYLTEFYQKLLNLAALTRNMSKYSPLIEEKSKNDHMRLLMALGEKNAEQSERLMREHLRSTCRTLVNNYLNLPGGV